MGWRQRQAELDLRWQKVNRVDPLTPGAHANDAYEATYENGSRGVLKPVTGEKANLRVAIEVGTYWRREVAVYRLDQMLEFFLVPVTVSREAEGMFGSMQAFALGGDGGAVADYSTLDQHMMGVLDYVAGNTDRNLSNWLTQADSRPAAIDNGLALPKTNASPILSQWVTEIKDKPLDVRVVRRLKSLDSRRCGQVVRECGIEEDAIDAMLLRLAEARSGTVTFASWPVI